MMIITSMELQQGDLETAWDRRGRPRAGKTALKEVARVEAEKKEHEEYLVVSGIVSFKSAQKHHVLGGHSAAMMVEALDGGYFEGPPSGS